MFLDFNTPKPKSDVLADLPKGKGSRVKYLFLVGNLVFASVNLVILINKTAQIHPKKPVLIQCSEADMRELKRSSDVLESIQKDLKNNTTK
jgi:hypothetical protein